jgi:hypothetical protein
MSNNCSKFDESRSWLACNTQFSWDKLHKLSQTKNWVFIWHSNQVAYPILKKDFDALQLAELKEMATNHRIKNNL